MLGHLLQDCKYLKTLLNKIRCQQKNCLTMDVPTRWNSTFTILDGAIKCQKTFERLEAHDPSYLQNDDIPTTEDWDDAKCLESS